MTRTEFTKASRLLFSMEHAVASLQEKLTNATTDAGAARDKLTAAAIQFCPFKPGDTCRIAAADRVSNASCAHVSGIVLPSGEPGWNAVFILEGSKSVICRIDHANYAGAQDGLHVTTAVFSRDAVTAGYLRDQRRAALPES